MTVDVTEGVRRKALAQGDEGRRWLDELPVLVDAVATEWALDIGEPLSGASGGYVTNVVSADGTAAVLKAAIPDGLAGQALFADELLALLLGAGPAYVNVLAYDEQRRVVLLERLGRRLSQLGLPLESEIGVVAATLAASWRPVAADTRLRRGDDKALWLGEFIHDLWDESPGACQEVTARQAFRYAQSRHDAFDPSRAVLIHGDGHPGNILENPEAAGGGLAFKLIDPEGLVSEPAHDLGIPLRSWNEAFLAGDPSGDAMAACTALADLTGVDGSGIWEWAFIERVSTGLYLKQLGYDEGAAAYLTVAAACTGHDM